MALFALPTFNSSLEHAHRERRVVQYPPTHVYNVVSNVAEYKHFVPWCIDSVVRTRTGNLMVADLAVGFHLFSERYTSRVTLDPVNRVTAIAADTQLFSRLVNDWSFAPGPTPGSCYLTFKVEFAFRSVIYSQAAGLFLDEVVKKMVTAFEQRCAQQWQAMAASASQQPPVVIAVKPNALAAPHVPTTTTVTVPAAQTATMLVVQPHPSTPRDAPVTISVTATPESPALASGPSAPARTVPAAASHPAALVSASVSSAQVAGAPSRVFDQRAADRPTARSAAVFRQESSRPAPPTVHLPQAHPRPAPPIPKRVSLW